MSLFEEAEPIIEEIGSANLPKCKEDVPDLAVVEPVQIREDETDRLDKTEQNAPYEANPQLQ